MGVMLLMQHPQVATRDCKFCQEVLHDETTGKPVQRAGHLVQRHAGCPPPCRMHKGCPKGTPEKPKSLSERNMMTYQHYLECRAVGIFPDDPIVRRNAQIIRMAEDEVERSRQITPEFLAAAFGGGK